MRAHVFPLCPQTRDIARRIRHVSKVPTTEVGSYECKGRRLGPSNRNKPFRVDVRDSLEGTDFSRTIKALQIQEIVRIFRIEKDEREKDSRDRQGRSSAATSRSEMF